MAQGTRLTQYKFNENALSEDVSVEADPEPFLVATNVFLSPTKVRDIPQRRRVGPQPVRRQNHHLPRNRAGKRRFTWRSPPR